MFTKKKIVTFMCLSSIIVFFLLFFFLPREIVESRTENAAWFFAVKIAFLSITAAITLSLALVAIVRRDFVNGQIATFSRFKHLLKLLVKRDFTSRYRKSMLGVLWSLLNPLLTMLVMTMVFSYLFRFDIPNFPVYLLSGQIIFLFFSESTTRAMTSMIENENIIKKVYIPKYIFPLSRLFSSLVNLFFSFIAFVLVAVVTQAPFHWTILLVPIPILYLFIFSLGIGMLLSSLSVFFRDLTYLYGIMITLFTYLTPLFYPVDILPEVVLRIIGLNPMYHFVDYFRCVAVWGVVPDLWSNIVCVGFALAALCSGVYMVMKQQDRYILYM